MIREPSVSCEYHTEINKILLYVRHAMCIISSILHVYIIQLLNGSEENSMYCIPTLIQNSIRNHKT
jgi:hypothetical protein